MSQMMTYRWNEQWAQIPEGIELGFTHGVAVDRQGLVYVFNQSRHSMLIFEGDGRFVGTWEELPSERFLGAHGLTYVADEAGEYFWLTDQHSGEVVKTTLSGGTVRSIARPDHEAYATGAEYAPTWAAESPVDGSVYVADGYGSSLIHHYDADGRYLKSNDGSGGAGTFKCPHAVWIGRRPHATQTREPVLYVSDRGNSRIQVYGLDGAFIKAFEQEHPCSFSECEGQLLVPDLHAFINIYDETDQLVVERLGENSAIMERDDWPNVPRRMRVSGRFNSPHNGCFDHAGNIYIVEWIREGRIIKLTRPE